MTMHVPNQQFRYKVKESQEALPIVYCDRDELVEIQGLLLVLYASLLVKNPLLSLFVS